jgi:hypothetical protein
MQELEKEIRQPLLEVRENLTSVLTKADRIPQARSGMPVLEFWNKLWGLGTENEYTVTRIDGTFHQPHRMAPDQTIRVMESNFDICDGHIRFFPAFPMEIFDHFEVFRFYSLSRGWKSSTF